MRTDAIRVAVRPRSTLECLDLAALVCGRRPLAVALATALGALPCIAVNRALFAGVDDEALLPALVTLGLEAPWAAVPLTLYLGQAVFSDRFSWRAAIRAFLGGLPALLVFQGLFRAVCLTTLLLAPVAFVTLYHLDQVVLLERPTVAKTWSRRGVVNRGTGSRLLALALLDCLVLVLGLIAGANFLTAVAGLWRGGASTAATVTGVVPTLMSWTWQVALWATCGFLTIVRFFTYLDGRIRREAWDVELKLRADETYGSLARAEPRRAGMVAVALLIAVATLGVPAAAADASGRPSAARQALEHQGFPWYDAAADRYRPLIDAGRPASDAAEPRGGSEANGRGGRRSRGTGGGSGGGSGSGMQGGSGGGGGGAGSPRPPSPPPPPAVPPEVGRWLLVALLVIVVVGLVVFVARYGLGRGTADLPAESADEDATPEPEPDSLPAGIRLADGDLLGRCAAEAERGDFTAAMLLFHAWLLVDLHRRGIVALARGKTNGQYAREVAAAAPALRDLFRASSGLFEDAFFGRLRVERDAFLAVWARRDLAASPPALAGSTS